MKSEKYVVFQTGTQQFGFAVTYVNSIEKVMDITELPKLPDHVIGIMNVRGRLLPVLDTLQILHNHKLSGSENNKILVVDFGTYPIGFLVEDAQEILDVSSEEIREVNGLVSQGATYISGVVQTSKGVITLLNPTELLKNLDDSSTIRALMEEKGVGAL